jgi:hypothetical protein
MKGEDMSVNQTDFAVKFAECGNCYEAAVYAGAKRGVEAAYYGVKLLFASAVRNRVASLKLKGAECPAEQGLRKIAFGRPNDAVRLAFTAEVTPNLVETLDLSYISEIKVGKGTVEIKFCDRIRALEKLCEIEDKRRGREDGYSLIEAIYGREEDDD